MIATKTALTNICPESDELVLITDNELIGKYLLANDAEAFEELVRRHSGMIMGVCSSLLLHSHDAEDAFQSTFLILSRKAKSLINHVSIAGWLYQVALRNCLQIRRRKGRAKETEMTSEPAEGTNEPWQSISQVQERDLVFQEINRLPKRYRDVIVLCHLEGRSRREVAEMLDCTVSSVKAALARARNQLRSRLIRSGLVTSAMLLMLRESTVSASELVSKTLIASTVQVCQGHTPTHLFGTSPEFIQLLAIQGVMSMHTANIVKSLSVTAFMFLLTAIPAVVIGQQFATSSSTTEPIEIHSSVDKSLNTQSGHNAEISIVTQDPDQTPEPISLSNPKEASTATTPNSSSNQNANPLNPLNTVSEFDLLGSKKFDIENSQEYWELMMNSYEASIDALKHDAAASSSAPGIRSAFEADIYELKAKIVEAKLNIERINSMKQKKMTVKPNRGIHRYTAPISQPIPGDSYASSSARSTESARTSGSNTTEDFGTTIQFTSQTSTAGGISVGSATPVQPGESLLVELMSDSSLNRRVTVQADNTIRMPLVGTIQVEGKTPSEIEETVNERLSTFMKDPDSFVSRENMSSPAPFRGLPHTPGSAGGH